MKLRAACVVLGFLCLAQLTFAQSIAETSALPRLVRFGGTVKDVNGNPLAGVVGITFAFYSEQTGGTALWLETQNVTAESSGRYVALLGSSKPDGLPTELFTTEQARWVGVQVSGQAAEQPRVLLLSVPYALKAADSETLGGKPASAYLLNPQQREGVPASAQGNPAAASKAASTTDQSAISAISGSGTTNYIPRWTSSANLGNSVIFQSSAGKLGIGTTSPLATLDIRESTGMRAIASGNGIAVYGNATVASGTGKGVEGDTSSTSGIGVLGQAHATSGNTIGVEGISSSGAGTAGVFNNTGGGNVLSGQNNGTVVFTVNGSGVTQVGTQSTTPAGVLNATSTSLSNAGLAATGFGGSNVNGTSGVVGTGGAVTGDYSSTGGTGLAGNGGNGAGRGGAGVVGIGGFGEAPSGLGGDGVDGYASTGGCCAGSGVAGYGTFGSTGVTGVGGDAGESNAGAGVYASGGTGGPGVPGGAGVWAEGAANNGTPGTDGDGIYATNPDGGTASTGGYAGYFRGDINVTGAIFAGTKDFKIDHPMDPANKYLLHSSVESSEMMNIYSGNATLDGSGEAIVQLPTWFEAVNGDFRYQLTSIGAPGPGLYIAQEISRSRFKIAGGSAGSKVSWQVTAVRRDAYAKAYPLIVEQVKSAKERGYYIHPELYGAPKERGIAWARHPDTMRPLIRKGPSHSPKLQQTKTPSR
jgi:hypothetical protein